MKYIESMIKRQYAIDDHGSNFYSWYNSMNLLYEDKFYKQLHKKIEDATFIEGKNYKFPSESYSKYYDRKTGEEILPEELKKLSSEEIYEKIRSEKIEYISEYPSDKLTDIVCYNLVNNGKSNFRQVPDKCKTRDFYLNSFWMPAAYDYIKSSVQNENTIFDRQFFKDLIATTSFATAHQDNCFEIMPLEYIDEEMCTLAMLSSANEYCPSGWFYTVLRRKPGVLTEEMWKLGARLYGMQNDVYKQKYDNPNLLCQSEKIGVENKFLNVTPEKYKDKEYYFEMCSCGFDNGKPFEYMKKSIMDYVPDNILTSDFLLELLMTDVNTIIGFNEKGLETVVPKGKSSFDGEKVWQLVVRLKGNTIKFIPLNDERVEFFLNTYSKSSDEYTFSFKDKYKDYLYEKKAMIKEKFNIPDLVKLPIHCIGWMVPISESSNKKYIQTIYDKLGINIVKVLDNNFYGVILPKGLKVEDNNKLVDQNGNVILTYETFEKYQSTEICSINKEFISNFEADLNIQPKLVRLPIDTYFVPEKLQDEYDSTEYIKMIYEKLGINIVAQFDKVFYTVILPEGWKIEKDWNSETLVDQDGNKILYCKYSENRQNVWVDRIYNSNIQKKKSR